jgi:E3 ubiquitin-protein ligase BAH
MKFSQQFRSYLDKSGFPPQWVQSAINYRQLKKCIKQVEAELTALGLDTATLQTLLEHVDAAQSRKGPSSQYGADGNHFEYCFRVSTDASNAPIVPKLLFLVDIETGQPLDARLAPETRTLLHQLAIQEDLTNIRISDDASELLNHTSSIDEDATSLKSVNSRSTRLVEIPLTKDSEFFIMLQDELTGLAKVQEQEKVKLTTDIQSVGKVLVKATSPQDTKAQKDLKQWRQIFELYLDNEIFFATLEQHHGVRTSAQAQKAFGQFIETAQAQKLFTQFKRAESTTALQQFLAINTELLQCLKFQEINQTAMSKILKKFDKRTALGAKTTFPTSLPESTMALLSQDFSKALAAQVSTDILSVVPQLDDYLCPICFMIAHRPVRLRCQHVFCIRCLIVMQRGKKDCCPLCREQVVMEANAEHLDIALMNFMSTYFREEVKAKQKANEMALAKDQYGSLVDARCTVM